MQMMITGVVSRGYQFASGAAVGREKKPSPFSAGTIALQMPHFRDVGIDLEDMVPGLKLATINLEIGNKVRLLRADYSARIDWTANEDERIDPEQFSFIRCCFIYKAGGPDVPYAYYPGLIYYPHPETKPTTNWHHFDKLEVLTQEVRGLAYGTPAAIACRSDAFEPF
jgi:hypothetical protein